MKKLKNLTGLAQSNQILSAETLNEVRGGYEIYLGSGWSFGGNDGTLKFTYRF